MDEDLAFGEIWIYQAPIVTRSIGDKMGKKISEIRKTLQAASLSELPAFIDTYGTDSRAGVTALVKRAEKKINEYEKELARTEKMKEFEKKYASFSYICGVDEVGRGPLAGPVVAGAVILPKDCEILCLNDSKQLTEKKREELYEVIMAQAVATGLGFVPPERIDEINILQATYEAMREAISKLQIIPDLLLNDAVTIPGVSIKQVPIVKGDAKSVSIAAASIIAKVTRDRMMVEYDSVYPGYGFAAHKGYGVKEHINAIRKLGPTPIHRKSFIKNFVENN